MAVKSYQKGSDLQLSKDFQAMDFDCKCEEEICKDTLIDENLVTMLQLMQDRFGCDIHINEAYRCPTRQQWIRDQKNPDGTPKYETVAQGVQSTHEMGMASDIKTLKHTGDQLEFVARKMGFRAVGVGKMFAHVDTRDCLTRTHAIRRWTYKY